MVTSTKIFCEYPSYCYNLSSFMVLTSQELNYSFLQFRHLTSNQIIDSISRSTVQTMTQSVFPSFSSLGLNQLRQLKCLKQCLAHSRCSINMSYYCHSSSLYLPAVLPFPYILSYLGQREVCALLPRDLTFVRVLCSLFLHQECLSSLNLCLYWVG